MTKEKKRVIIKRMAARIAEAFRPKKIILFGSHAYGRPRSDSDVDLLVVMDSKKRPIDRARDVIKTLGDFSMATDIMVRTPRELRHRLAIGDFFIEEILQKGRILYER